MSYERRRYRVIEGRMEKRWDTDVANDPEWFRDKAEAQAAWDKAQSPACETQEPKENGHEEVRQQIVGRQQKRRRKGANRHRQQEPQFNE